jgi:hypothetical protein
MPRRSSSTTTRADWPPVLRQLLRAAEAECPRGHADALHAFTALALRKVPARGIFDPGMHDEHELFGTIESIARSHLALADARSAWQRAMEAAGLTLEQRDEIESASMQVQSVSDTAYFYAGLAFGLAFLSLGSSK